MLLSDADFGVSNWVSKTRDLLLRYDIKSTDNFLAIKHKIKQQFQVVMLKNLNEQIAEDRKLKLYATFKWSFEFEFYLDTKSDFKIRSTLAKLHLSAHTLQIETGTFHNKT